jgi:hypothetical protein
MGSSRFIPDTIAPNLPPNPKCYSKTSIEIWVQLWVTVYLAIHKLTGQERYVNLVSTA